MKWWCLFLIRDDAGKYIVEEYFHQLNVVMRSAPWRQLSWSHLMPLMPKPSGDVHLAIVPFLLSTCEELQVSWKASKLDSFQSVLQSWSDDIAKLKNTYHFPSQPSPAEGTSVAKRVDGLLDDLPIPGSCMLEIIIDKSLFSDLDLKTNVLLYGSLFRAYMWNHAAFRPLGVSSNSLLLNNWLNDLTVTGWDIDPSWLPVWKGRINAGDSMTACHFELQCFAPIVDIRPLNELCAPVMEEDSVVWSSSIEVLEDFSFSRLPMHLIIPIAFRLLPLSSVQTLPEWLLKNRTDNQEMCVTLRLSYWDKNEMKTNQSKPSSTDWQRNLLMEKPSQSASVGDQCSQEASGYFHFVLLANQGHNLLYPLEKMPSLSDMNLCSGQESTSLPSGQESTSLPPVVESATCELLEDIPLVCTDRILDSVHHNNSPGLDSLREFIASGKSCSPDFEELEISPHIIINVDESDSVTDSFESSSSSPPDHGTHASLGDPSDWPERRFLVSESLKGSASSENCALSNAGGSAGHKVFSISAAEILKVFDESGLPKGKPLSPVHPVGQSTKPSVSWDQLESTLWPDILQCKYHDVYYNTDNEVLENSCCAMKDQYLVNETASTCTSYLGSSALPHSKKPSSKARVLVNKDYTTLLGHQQRNSFSSTRNGHVASAPLRRSPRKSFSTRNMPQKTVPLAWNSPQAAASPFLRKSPRKTTRQHECDNSRKERVDASGTASEQFRMKLRVAVANALEKNGVSQSSPLYKPCGKKLFAICSTFAQDLIGSGRTSELLQNIADSHAKQVVNFEMLKPGNCKSETSGASNEMLKPGNCKSETSGAN